MPAILENDSLAQTPESPDPPGNYRYSGSPAAIASDLAVLTMGIPQIAASTNRAVAFEEGSVGITPIELTVNEIGLGHCAPTGRERKGCVTGTLQSRVQARLL
jgi:hypothetical protein